MPNQLKTIQLPSSITVRDLALKLDMPGSRIISELIKHGVFATINERIDFEIAVIVLENMGYQAVLEEKEKETKESAKSSNDKQKRAPIVTILGHVDHGKTTLLDAIRQTDIAGGEAGGITQHISSYQLEVDVRGRKEVITFLDTPGHEAFTTLRQRGANVTDIAVIIIAADDGVMPQTIEAIDLVKQASAPIIIAVNKIDKPGVNPAKIRQQLAEQSILVEGWGGNVPIVEISAKNKIGIENLLDMILLVSDMQELAADPNAPARGIIIDSRLDSKKGLLAIGVVLDGSLKQGDEIITSSALGKVKKIEDYKGSVIKQAGPSCPAIIMGFKTLPAAGEIFKAEKKISKSKIAELLEKSRKERIGKITPLTLDRLLAQKGEIKVFNIVLKADAPGSLEAILSTINKINVPGLKIDIIKSGIGNFTGEDINTAKSSNAIIFGFNLAIGGMMRKIAERENVIVHTHSIIYELVDDIKECVAVLLGPEIVKTEIGKMKVLALFGKSKRAQIIGGKIVSGKVRSGCLVVVNREKQKVGEGEIQEVKVGKEDVPECSEGNECGIKFTGNLEVKEGDSLEFIIEEEKKRVI
ncbi:MAG: translation initiation factor IF-2 [bacterium]